MGLTAEQRINEFEDRSKKKNTQTEAQREKKTEKGQSLKCRWDIVSKSKHIYLGS